MLAMPEHINEYFHVAEDSPFILASPPAVLLPQHSLEGSEGLDLALDATSVRHLSRTSLDKWDVKAPSAFSEAALGANAPPALHRTSTMLKQGTSGKLERGAWLRRRPGATQFEILQASIKQACSVSRLCFAGIGQAAGKLQAMP